MTEYYQLCTVSIPTSRSSLKLLTAVSRLSYTHFDLIVRSSSSICARVTDILGRTGNAERDVSMIDFNNGALTSRLSIRLQFIILITSQFRRPSTAELHHGSPIDHIYLQQQAFTWVLWTPSDANLADCKHETIDVSTGLEYWKKIYDSLVGARIANTGAEIHAAIIHSTPMYSRYEKIYEKHCF